MPYGTRGNEMLREVRFLKGNKHSRADIYIKKEFIPEMTPFNFLETSMFMAKNKNFTFPFSFYARGHSIFYFCAITLLFYIVGR